MAQQTINIGTAPDDHTGDPVRTAFQKTNDNFTEVYARTPKITVSTTAPSSPAVGDVWIDSN